MSVSSAGRAAATSGTPSPHRRRPHTAWPSWADWNQAQKDPFTVGVEEEVLLLDVIDRSMAQSSDSVLTRLSQRLRGHAAAETHAAVIELATGIHGAVTPAEAELARLRSQLARELDAIGLCAASAGMYPLKRSAETRISGSERYHQLASSMRSLARREPTLALHVHVGVIHPEDAIRLLNGLRQQLPLLLALSANSPFAGGSDTGFASARTVTFQAFPRTGIPRRFADYGEYVRTVDMLIASGALPDPTFLWWDVRLQPALGTVEVRVMDSQCVVGDTAALVALVVSLAKAILTGGLPEPDACTEVLAENRFLAARDGLSACLIDPEGRRLIPVRRLLDDLLDRCGSEADPADLAELGRVPRLAQAGGADRQRGWVRKAGLDQLLATLSQRFAGSNIPGRPRPTTERSGRCVAGLHTRVRPS